MRFLASILQVAGAVALAVAGFIIGPVVGFAVVGVAALVGGLIVEVEVQRGSSQPPPS